MKKRKLFFYILAALIILIILILLINIFSYRQFEAYREKKDGTRCSSLIMLDKDCTVLCEHYTKVCYCIGFLTEFESYPPSFSCKGINFCRNTDKTECR